MPRIRTIKPEFWQDEKLSPLPSQTRLVFLGLISMADDAGRLLDNLKIIDAFIFPNTDESAKQALSELAALGRIERGFTQQNQAVIQIANFKRHQKIDHPNPYVLEPLASHSRIIREPVATLSVSVPVSVPVTLTNQQPTTPPSAVPALPAVKAKPVGGKPSPEFLQAWAEYPKRPGNSKADALKAWTARLREGCRSEDMLEGTKRYAAYVKASGTEPRFVKMAATFFGPGKHFEADYAYTAPPKAEDALYAQIAAEANDLSGYVV